MLSRVFQDFDEFAGSVRDVESKMLMRNPERRLWSINSIDLGQIDLQLGELGSGNIAQGQLRHDGFMLYLPLTSDVEYTVNGVTIAKKSLAILEPGCEFCFSTKDKHDWCVAFIPIDICDRDGALALRESRSCRVTRPNPQVADALQATLLQIFATAAKNPTFESSLAATRAAEKVLRIANRVVGPGQSPKPNPRGRPSIPRQKIIQSSMELLKQQAGGLVSVQDLTAAAGVTERTLRNAFTEYFGVGPVRYLQLRRLHQVHRALKATDPEERTVTQVLTKHGEWAFGRFASRYRQLFGELPSETLRQRMA